jgi:transcription elongation factor Elf1
MPEERRRKTFKADGPKRRPKTKMYFPCVDCGKETTPRFRNAYPGYDVICASCNKKIDHVSFQQWQNMDTG